MRKILTVVIIGAVVLVAWFVNDSTKPKLLAKVGLTKRVVSITNGNETAWDSPTVILNDGFGGPIFAVADKWAPNETRELQLSDFRGRFNHQLFKPEYEEVREVIIKAPGFQLGIYETH